MHLLGDQVERPARRDIAARGLALRLGGLEIEQSGEFGKPREIGLGVRGGVHRMRVGEEIGDREIGAVLLAPHIGADRAVEVEGLRRGDPALEVVEHNFAVERGGRA